MHDVMIDLETLSLRPGAVILSIGAVEFDSSGLGREFYAIVHAPSQKQDGFHTDPETVQWWSEQEGKAHEVIAASLDPTMPRLDMVLMSLRGFVGKSRVWGNGADFDIALLTESYRRIFDATPWSHKDVRCYRTVMALLQGEKAVPEIPHHALSDAKAQALALIRAMHAQTSDPGHLGLR